MNEEATAMGLLGHTMGPKLMFFQLLWWAVACLRQNCDEDFDYDGWTLFNFSTSVPFDFRKEMKRKNSK